MKVGRPLDPAFPGGPATQRLPLPHAHSLTGLGSARLGRSLTRRGRDWAASDVLRSRLEQYADRIQKQYPHTPDFASLLVMGEGFASRLATVLAPPISLTVRCGEGGTEASGPGRRRWPSSHVQG